MEKVSLLIISLILDVYFPVYIFAETIITKSGQKIEGKIIEKTDKYIKIDFYEVPLIYFFDEIESIDGNKISLPQVEAKEVEKNIADNSIAEWYINDDFRFKMQKPFDWELKEVQSLEKGIPMLSLGFQRASQDGNFKNTLVVNISKLNKLDKTWKKGGEFIAYADNVIYHATKNLNKSGFITETKSINNVSVREAKFEYTDTDGDFTNILMFF